MFRAQLIHAVQNFVVCLVILVLAGVLAKYEMYCVEIKMPAYYILFVRVVTMFLAIIDGIVLIGTASVFAIKMLQAQASSSAPAK